MDTLSARPAAAACDINPTGLSLWRCHTHGSPAWRLGPCLAASSDRRLAHVAAMVRLGSAARRALESEQHIRAARGVGDAQIWSDQATATRLIIVHP